MMELIIKEAIAKAVEKEYDKFVKTKVEELEAMLETLKYKSVQHIINDIKIYQRKDGNKLLPIIEIIIN